MQLLRCVLLAGAVVLTNLTGSAESRHPTILHGQTATNRNNATNILIYDNGLHRPEGQYTRALELDFTTMKARRVWEYRHDPDIFTAAVGSVARLDNGNTLVNFGFGASPGAVDPNVIHRIVEVADGGEVVAEIELQSFGKAVQYRSHVIQRIAGEQLIKVGDVEGVRPNGRRR